MRACVRACVGVCVCVWGTSFDCILHAWGQRDSFAHGFTRGARRSQGLYQKAFAGQALETFMMPLLQAQSAILSY